MNKHIEAGNPDFAGYPGEDHKMDELEFLRKEKLDTHNTVYDVDKKELFNF